MENLKNLLLLKVFLNKRGFKIIKANEKSFFAKNF